MSDDFRDSVNRILGALDERTKGILDWIERADKRFDSIEHKIDVMLFKRSSGSHTVKWLTELGRLVGALLAGLAGGKVGGGV